METVTMDPIDRGLIHALQIDARAPLRTIAGVLDVSENTIARRYRRLREAEIVRVIGVLDGRRLGYTSWTMRLQCTPDAAGAVAGALAQRPDTAWVYLMSGGTEVACNVQMRSADERDALLLEKLPKTGRVIAVSAHALLHATALPRTWQGLHALSAEQVAALAPPPIEPDATPGDLGSADQALLDALARDGRLGYAELASITGWSDSTVKRRVEALRRSGMLSFLLDVPPEAFGFGASARLWMAVPPSSLTSVAEALARHPEISFCAVTTGPTNLLANVNCRDTSDLYRYLTERIGALEEIRSVETAPIIRTVKRAGAVLRV